jgi:hypothetical protein
MKHKLLLAFVASALVLTACNGDEIDDLKKRVNTLEEITGSNEPIVAKFATTNGDDDAVVKNTAYYFKAGSDETSYISDYGDGTFYVYVERFSDVEWYNGAWFEFYYDSETGEVYNQSGGMYYDNTMDGQYLNSRFYYYDAETTAEITLNSINTTTGKVNVSFHGTTTAASTNNVYSNKPMTLNLTFKGQLDVYHETNL